METHYIISWIPPKASSYDRFVGVIKSVAGKHISRGFRKQYISGWDESCIKLFEAFQKNNNSTIADELIGRLNVKRKQRWSENTVELDFTHSSHKTWD